MNSSLDDFVFGANRTGGSGGSGGGGANVDFLGGGTPATPRKKTVKAVRRNPQTPRKM